MARIKPGKNIRVPEQAISLMAELREVIQRNTSVRGLKIKPVTRLGDGEVVATALALALALDAAKTAEK